MDVIKVNKELFEAFNLLKDIENSSFDFSKECIIKSKINKTFTLELEILNEYPFDDFIRALVVGFELEESKEEFLSREYELLKKMSKDKARYSKEEIFVFKDRMQAVCFTLNVLDIKIKGINN